MAQTHEGAIKTAAKHAGIPVDEYRRRIAAGLKKCTECREWKPTDDFAIDRSRSDGLLARCRSCSSARGKRAYVPRKSPGVRGSRRVPLRDGDRRQARRRVNYLVEQGLIPRPGALPCTDCGHRVGDTARRHEYDHHLGYAPEHHERVEAVCSVCHGAREAKRNRERKAALV
jgi:hypothetical protein